MQVQDAGQDGALDLSCRVVLRFLRMFILVVMHIFPLRPMLEFLF